MQLTGKQLVNAYRSMCTIREFAERVHKALASGQVFGFVRRYASTHRGHSHSIEQGAQS
jgi:TPP-dependent pyruvate/acetoin dehydrogenase alpha subunit